MKIVLNYGRQGLAVELPDDWKVSVLGKPAMPVLADPGRAVLEALARPVDCRPLIEEARGLSRACLLICDITRPVPNDLILPAVVRQLLEAGLEPRNITVLVATGLHRPNLDDELREVVGDDWVLDTVRVVNHYARRDEEHVQVGLTSRGTPVRLDRRLVEADLRLAVGLVEPHFMAGYSGGRKVITPGAAHEETIRRLHAAVFLEDPGSANCVLAGNPLHQEQLEVIELLGGALAVNAVIDEQRRLSFVNFGRIQPSHAEAVAFVRPFAELEVPRRFPTVLTSAAGYPLDKTYYQTVKGMVGAMEILEPDGDLFIVSECSEGLGSAEYVAAQERLAALGPDGFLDEIGPKRLAAVDEWQTEMQVKAMRRGRIHLYSHALSRAETALTGVEVVDSLEAALAESLARTKEKRLAVIPEGPYLVPRFRPPGRAKGDRVAG